MSKMQNPIAHERVVEDRRSRTEAASIDQHR
jgi:hypothetical protein